MRKRAAARTELQHIKRVGLMQYFRDLSRESLSEQGGELGRRDKVTTQCSGLMAWRFSQFGVACRVVAESGGVQDMMHPDAKR